MKKIHTHYDNLKVSRTAPIEVIRAAYRALSQMYHPDRNPGNTKAGRIMATINGSYEVLSDPEKRREHDKWIAKKELKLAQAAASTNQACEAQPPSSDSIAEALAFGVSEEEIEYLGVPIKSTLYQKKYRVSEGRLSKAIRIGKIRSVVCRDVLWVQDKKLA